MWRRMIFVYVAVLSMLKEKSGFQANERRSKNKPTVIVLMTVTF